MLQWDVPGNTERTHIDIFRRLRTKVRRVLVRSSIQNQNIQYTEMTHMHKFRSLRTKVRSLLVVISNQKQRHAMNLQTAHRRKGSWLDKWVPLGAWKRQTTPKPQPAHYFEAPAQQNVTSPFKSLTRKWRHGDHK